MATQEATETLAALGDDIADGIDAAPDIDLSGVDDQDILAAFDDEGSSGHLVRNLVLLILAASVVGAVVAMVLRGRR